ncbi:hypothetical protein GOBAR_AA36513 [Gossypium barbadense]|uniref:Protein-tyrosine-phosphatase n=1 Tax=Gossypium barbadense TaxID=3634 RepID=A0A2P5VZE3_GOSBA|nr:hypothetical protein GOBAR_AA36513 [Gossypium barbadense]
MVGKEDAPVNPTPTAPSCQLSGSRKMFWRSASWSSSRTSLQIPETDKDIGADTNVINGTNDGQARRYPPPPPLTPRSQQNSKARLCLPPLQPLSIARRSLDEWPKAGSDDLGEWPQPPTPSGNKSGERLKLDLSSIQRSNDKNGGLMKREKIAFFDKECSKVAEHIYLGGDAVAKDREILKQNGITHVLNCVGFVCPEYFKADFVYRTLWLQDSPSEDITSILYDVFDYFEHVREQSGRVFVHCCQGVSRSTSLVIAYLMWREGQSFDGAFQYVKAARGIADPNMGFACQLLQCQKRVHAFPLSPSSLLRMYRIAPHSPYDPLHLVPKMLNDPSPSVLDSRGAFIVQIPSAVYIWIGKNCESIMERDARGAYVKAARGIADPNMGFACQLLQCQKRVHAFPLSPSSLLRMYRIAPHSPYDPLHLVPKMLNDPSPSVLDSRGAFIVQIPSAVYIWIGKNCESIMERDARGAVCQIVRYEKVQGPLMMIKEGEEPINFWNSFSNNLPLMDKSGNIVGVGESAVKICPGKRKVDSYNVDFEVFEKAIKGGIVPPFASSENEHETHLPARESSWSMLRCKFASVIMKDFVSAPKILLSRIYSDSMMIAASSPLKKVSTSLAERRGSLSKSLKLPVPSDNVRETSDRSSFLVKKVRDRRNDNTSSSCESDIEIVFDSKHGVGNGGDVVIEGSNLKISPCRIANIDPHDKRSTFVSTYEPQKIHSPQDGFVSAVPNRMEESFPAFPGVIQPLVWRWPSIDKMTKFNRSDLDSKSAFAIFSPATAVGKNEDRILYFWIGKFYHHEKSLSPSSLLRMYRIAPHSPYDPLHLVPKMLNDPSPSVLDSRGAFIVQIPSAVYIWIGKNCESIMERDARGAVCQIVRYEKVQGPLMMIKEGEEPINFWNSFSNNLPLMDKSGNIVGVGESAVKICPGKRKVDSYNVDFEVFEKAIKGGIVPPFASSENEHETHLPARESSWSMLRCKFASVIMKDFVSAPKILLSRMYSDSMMIVTALWKDPVAIHPACTASKLPTSSGAKEGGYVKGLVIYKEKVVTGLELIKASPTVQDSAS